LLTALCAKVHAGDKSWQDRLLDELNTPTVGFITILHSIDTSSCYDWFTSMSKQNARRMVNSFIAQLWKIVWLGTLGVSCQDEILFRYALLSKLAIDILAQLIYNSKITTMLSHWPIGLAVIHGYTLLNLILNPKSPPSWVELYTIFVLTFSIYYVVQKYYQAFRKKIIGDQYQSSNISYFFDVLLGMACTVVPGRLSEIFVGLFYIAFPFVMLLLEYFIV